jgi:hypothetical protein
MRKVLLVGVVCVLLTASCGTIFHGTRKDISFRASPDCTVIVDGVEYQTPTIVKLKRGESHKVTFEKQGYKSQTIMIDNDLLVGTLIADIFLGGLIGVIVDLVDGAMYTLTPKDIDVKLHEEGVSLNLPEAEEGEFYVLLVDQAEIDAYYDAKYGNPE